MVWFFNSKKEVNQVKEDTKHGFESVKKDISAVSGWIKHLDSEKNYQQREIEELKEVLSSVRDDIESLKNIVSFIGEIKASGNSTKSNRLFNKQTAVLPVQTAVQTAVQTPNLDAFSITERAIIWVLLNTDMKLSYDDIAAMLGKEKSTIRGQINRIRQKSGLIEELIEQNGKKRVFIPEEIREKLLKKQKVRVNEKKKNTKIQKKQVSEY